MSVERFALCVYGGIAICISVIFSLINLPMGKTWLDFIQVFSVPSLAGLGAFLTWKSFQLARQKRNDDLFDRRFKFYTNIRDWYLLNCHGWYEMSQDERAELQVGRPIEIFRYASESRFLFGEDIKDHILEMPFKDPPFTYPIPKFPKRGQDRKEFERIREKTIELTLQCVVPEWFDRPFLRYMRFDR